MGALNLFDHLSQSCRDHNAFTPVYGPILQSQFVSEVVVWSDLFRSRRFMFRPTLRYRPGELEQAFILSCCFLIRVIQYCSSKIRLTDGSSPVWPPVCIKLRGAAELICYQLLWPWLVHYVHVIVLETHPQSLKPVWNLFQRLSMIFCSGL